MGGGSEAFFKEGGWFYLKMLNMTEIRRLFRTYFEQGNEEKVQELLEVYPWLRDEWQGATDARVEAQRVLIAAVGVIEDELAGPAPIDEIVYCLRRDFGSQRSEEEVALMLNYARDLGYVVQAGTGWSLTAEGNRICNNYLNSHLDG
ncbi:MAG: hypothetical protein Kow0069_38940 [Promethearchaeota archaeon]